MSTTPVPGIERRGHLPPHRLEQRRADALLWNGDPPDTAHLINYEMLTCRQRSDDGEIPVEEPERAGAFDGEYLH